MNNIFDKHPAPWKVACRSFAHVMDANGKEVCQCKDHDTAQQIVAEMNTLYQCEYMVAS